MNGLSSIFLPNFSLGSSMFETLGLWRHARNAPELPQLRLYLR
jgi:hypothetical protein